MSTPLPSRAPARCAACATELAPQFLACPRCARLVHGARCAELASAAEAALSRGDQSRAQACWREALTLLPEGTKQHAVLTRRLAASTSASTQTSTRASRPRASSPAPRGSRLGRATALTTAALIAWKLKFAIFGLLGKAKFLLMGLSQLGTLFTMLLSFGVYWQAFGWKLALGLIATMYVHEMGHVASLRRFGIPASAPMFIPGFGAFVRLGSYPMSPGEDARVGLAGPIWGTAAGWAVLLVGRLQGWPSFVAIAHVAAWMNLFNLLPVWQLDGSRGLRALSRPQRAFLAVMAFATWLVVRDGMVILMVGILAFRAWQEKPGPRRDDTVLVSFTGLLLALALLLRASPH